MIIFRHIVFVFLLAILSSCISTLKSNNTNSNDEYSEDLTAYLPKDPVDTVAEITIQDEIKPLDSTLIITARLDSALLYVNTYNAKKTKYIEGLTIQLYSGTDRSKAKEVQMRAFRHFAHSKPRIIFDQPNYKVRMEEFYSQLEAYPVFKTVQSKFHKAILVPTRIKVSKNKP
jgi:hypothetical protein